MTRKQNFPLLFFLAILTLTSIYYRSLGVDQSHISYKTDYYEYGLILDNINFSRIVEHVKYFSSLGSRFTGSFGYEKAAYYIYEKYKSYGLINVTYDEYTIPLPIDYGGNLTVNIPGKGSEVFEIYPMAPNLVAPSTLPPGGVDGELVYVGEGKYSDCNDKKIKDSIVLMDYNTMKRWLNIASLGAKAVIFVEPKTTSFFEAEDKNLKKVPFNFPRFYIRLKDGLRLIKLLNQYGVLNVHMEARSCWEPKKVKNVVGFVKGIEYPDKIIILSSYFDSESGVISVSPGAEEATGISFLLELAKFLSKNPPKYTVMFVAYSGHHQGFAGSRFFVEHYLHGNKSNIGKRIVAQINLDLSTGSDTIGFTYLGNFYETVSVVGHRVVTPELYAPLFQYLKKIIDEVNSQTGNKYPFLSESVSSPITQYSQSMRSFSYDSESLMFLNIPSFSIVTVNDFRLYVGTPLDTFEKLKLNNLKTQIELISCLITRALNDIAFYEKYLSRFPHSIGNWYITKGTVATYNTTIGWYSPIGNTLVVIDHPSIRERNFIRMSDENGSFTLLQLPLHGGLFLTTFETDLRIEAYKIDPDTGNVIYAPDQGRHRFAMITGQGVMVGERCMDIGFVTVFKCSSIFVSDYFDPATMNVPTVNENPSQVVIVNEHTTHVEPEYFSIKKGQDAGKGFSYAMVFVPSDMKVEILLGSTVDIKIPLAFLINSSETFPEGSGFILKEGEQKILLYPIYQFVRDMYYTNEVRLQRMIGAGFHSTSLIEEHKKNGKIIAEALNSLNNLEYDKFYCLISKVWKSERIININLRRNIEDMINSLPFFALLLLPFAFLLERFLFAAEGLRRILIIVSVFAIGIIGLFILHPAFQLASNSLLIFLGVDVIMLTIPILGVIGSNVMSLISYLRRAIKGEHFAEISKFSAATLSFSTGIRQMKRRKLRTILTFSSIMIIVAAMTALLSIETIQVGGYLETGGEPAYHGILLKREEWGHIITGIGDNTLQILETLYGKEATVAPRAWRFPLNPVYIGFQLFHNDRRLILYGILGITPQEKDVSSLDTFLVKGRWFMPSEHWSCILSESQAKILGITDVPTNVVLEGIELTVVGIIDDNYNVVTDLNGEQITPIDMLQVEELRWTTHLSPDLTLILPYDDVIMLTESPKFSHYSSVVSGAIVSIGIKLDPETVEAHAAETFSHLGGLYVYGGLENKTIMYSQKTGFKVIGWEIQLSPMIIASLTILNLMIGSVFERKKDVFVFSSLGLSPLHVAFMFLAESLIYGIIGALTGYVGALAFGKLMGALNLAAPLLSYSSGKVVLAIGTAIVVTVISSIYPVFLASKMVTPSLERTWQLPTKPKGDSWEIPLPFVIGSTIEVEGILAFLKELIDQHVGVDSEVFRILECSYGEETIGRRKRKGFSLNMLLAPYDAGIMQTAQMIMDYDPDTGKWHFNISLHRERGETKLWIQGNRRFIDLLRKQFLIWRSLSVKKREDYIRMFRESLEKALH